MRLVTVNFARTPSFWRTGSGFISTKSPSAGATRTLVTAVARASSAPVTALVPASTAPSTGSVVPDARPLFTVTTTC